MPLIFDSFLLFQIATYYSRAGEIVQMIDAGARYLQCTSLLSEFTPDCDETHSTEFLRSLVK